MGCNRNRHALVHRVERLLPFRAEDITASELASLACNGRLVLILNGWNEISQVFQERANLLFRTSIGQLGLIVTTRVRNLMPPIRDPIVFHVQPLNRAQRQQIIWESKTRVDKEKLINIIEYTDGLDEVTRIPLFLAALIQVADKSSILPESRYPIIRDLVMDAEQREDHKHVFEMPPFSGSHRQYLEGIALQMTGQDSSSIDYNETLNLITNISEERAIRGEITQLPESSSLLDLLSDHHLLLGHRQASEGVRFVHQQFQEWFAAEELYKEVRKLSMSMNPDEVFDFQRNFINQPAWEDAFLLLAEGLSDNLSLDPEIRRLAANLVSWTVRVDPFFAARLSRTCGEGTWNYIKEDLNNLFRQWYKLPEQEHKDCALMGMLSTGVSDFSDIIWPLLENQDLQIRLNTYRLIQPFPFKCLGANWREQVDKWQEDRRAEFIQESLWHATAEGFALAEEIASSDFSLMVRIAAMDVLAWNGASETVINILKKGDLGLWEAAAKAKILHLLPVNLLVGISRKMESILEHTADEKVKHVIINCFKEADIPGAVGFAKNYIETGDGSDKYKEIIAYVHKYDPTWVGQWLAEKIHQNTLLERKWSRYLEKAPASSIARLLEKALDEREIADISKKRLSVFTDLRNSEVVQRLLAKYCEMHSTIRKSGRTGYRPAHLDNFRDVLSAMHIETLIDAAVQINRTRKDVTAEWCLIDLFVRLFDTVSHRTHELTEKERNKLRELVINWIIESRDIVDESSELRAKLSRLLSHAGNASDIEFVQELLVKEIARYRKAEEARSTWLLSDQSGPIPIPINWARYYVDALTRIGGVRCEEILKGLLSEPGFSVEASNGLIGLLPEFQRQAMPIPAIRTDYSKIFELRKQHSEGNHGNFISAKQEEYALAIKKRVEALMEVYHDTVNKDTLSYELVRWANSLALICSEESIPLLLKIASVEGNEWMRIELIEKLVLRGFSVSGNELYWALHPIMYKIETQPFTFDNQGTYLLIRCLTILLFSDKSELAVEKLKQLLNTKKYDYDIQVIFDPLAASLAPHSEELLFELCDDERALRVHYRPLLSALSKIPKQTVKEKLLNLRKSRTLMASHNFVDHLANCLNDIASDDQEFTQEILSLCQVVDSSEDRRLLGIILRKLGGIEAAMEACYLLKDDTPDSITYDVRELILDTISEKVPAEESASTYYVMPKECNPLRERLYNLALSDPIRRKSAFLLLALIELQRNEIGKPTKEHRHPAIESRGLWPPL